MCSNTSDYKNIEHVLENLSLCSCHLIKVFFLKLIISLQVLIVIDQTNLLCFSVQISESEVPGRTFTEVSIKKPLAGGANT